MSKKNHWNDPAFKREVRRVISTGVLLDEEHGFNQLQNALNKWAGEHGFGTVTKASLRNNLNRSIWDRETTELVRSFVRRGLDLSSVYKTLNFLPRAMVDRKANSFRGHRVSTGDSVVFAAGYGTLVTPDQLIKSPRVDLIPPTPREPIEIKVGRPNYSVACINGMHIGLVFNQVFTENVARNGFIWAQRNRANMVFLTTGLMWLDVKKSQSHLTTHRALLSGIEYTPVVMDRDYVEMADQVLTDMPPDKVGFYTVNERVHNLAHGIRKVTTDKRGRPLFSGPIYIVFGQPEEELIEALAHNQVLYITTVMRLKAEAETKAAQAQLAYAKANGQPTKQWQREMEKWAKLAKRMIQTNVMHEFRRHFVRLIRDYLINLFQRMIPNCRVLAQGTSFFQIGSDVVEVHQHREPRSTSDFLGEFLKRRAGQRVLEGTMPDVVLLASAYSVNCRWAMVEWFKDQVQRSTPVIQLPVALDKSHLKRRLNQVVGIASPIERLLRHDQFEPGMVLLRRTNGAWSHDVVSSAELAGINESTSQSRSQASNGGYIYYLIDADNHFGHPWKTWFWDALNQRWLGLEMAVMEMLRREFLAKGRCLPIHGFANMGDVAQADHFPNYTQPHTMIQFFRRLELEFGSMCQDAKTHKDQALAKLHEMMQQSLMQIRLRGEFWVQRQMAQAMQELVAGSADVLFAILDSARRSRVRFKGVGQILFGREDARDIGVLSFVSGNHFEYTVDGKLAEGPFFADKAIDRVLIHQATKKPSLRFSEDELHSLVRAPLYGNTATGWGLVGQEGGHEWGLILRHQPVAKEQQNDDPLGPATTKVLEMGDFPGFLAGRKTLHLQGDRHRYGLVAAPEVIVALCASGTGNDPYGTRGFSPNNTGNLVIGLPAGGPKAGPVRVIPFNHDWVRRYMLEPFVIDWDRIFIDPV